MTGCRARSTSLRAHCQLSRDRNTHENSDYLEAVSHLRCPRQFRWLILTVGPGTLHPANAMLLLFYSWPGGNLLDAWCSQDRWHRTVASIIGILQLQLPGCTAFVFVCLDNHTFHSEFFVKRKQKDHPATSALCVRGVDQGRKFDYTLQFFIFFWASKPQHIINCQVH